MNERQDKRSEQSDIRRITKKRALAILFETAQSHLRGSGCGLAERPDARREALIRAAVRKLWRDAYQFDFPGMWPQ